MYPTSKDTMSPVHRRHSCCCCSSLPNFSMDWVCLQQSGICKQWTWIVWIFIVSELITVYVLMSHVCMSLLFALLTSACWGHSWGLAPGPAHAPPSAPPPPGWRWSLSLPASSASPPPASGQGRWTHLFVAGFCSCAISRTSLRPQSVLLFWIATYKMMGASFLLSSSPSGSFSLEGKFCTWKVQKFSGWQSWTSRHRQPSHINKYTESANFATHIHRSQNYYVVFSFWWWIYKFHRILPPCLINYHFAKSLGHDIMSTVDLNPISKLKQVFLTLGWSSFVFALCLPIEKIAYGDL